ncbi:DUF393 domain-containing protein [Fulvivirga sp. RKSG066]|uniref:thiol-disulfide oxidoreductase DCC family protein n=1 Tax=Fulvivirga aurantia TaxID=2529383 RepID=UPI0012BB4D42|nr:DCC1-like thiol-disulfide oxidoreductase family protein [Fulvivirga aurantia]MTI22171.1 DUF393 domain-containing protein [Fulvivirga aurantia]
MGASAQVAKDTIFFDGVCNLCNGAINFVIDRDERKKYQFAPLQSEAADKHLPDEFKSLNTIVLLTKEGRLYKKSRAALEISKYIGGLWFLLYGFVIVPRFIRDGVYDFIATNRYKWFGKRDTCRMPSPELKERFLESS